MTTARRSPAARTATPTSWPPRRRPTIPCVLGVGGTNLTADLTTGNYKSEVAWDDGYGQSGGGFSTRYAKPALPGRTR